MIDNSPYFYVGYAIPFVFIGGIIATIAYYANKRLKRKKGNIAK